MTNINNVLKQYIETADDYENRVNKFVDKVYELMEEYELDEVEYNKVKIALENIRIK